MNSGLALKRCIPCEIGMPPLTSKEFKPLLKQLKLEWEVIEGLPALPERQAGGRQGKKIRHEFKFKNFSEAIEFVNKVAKLAEEENHHPNIHIYYSRVVIDLTTHNIKGLSENDFIMAAKIESLFKI